MRTVKYLIGYNGSQSTLSGALSGIGNKWTQIWGWDNGNWSSTHNPTMTLPFPPVNVLSSGKAYWLMIKSGQAGNWTQ